jgi:hypothetical protein
MMIGMMGYLIGSFVTGVLLYGMRGQWRDETVQAMMEILEEGNYIEVRHEENGESVLIPRSKV